MATTTTTTKAAPKAATKAAPKAATKAAPKAAPKAAQAAPKAAQAAQAAPAQAAPAQATQAAPSGPYRANAAWAQAHAAARPALRGNPAAQAALQVATHLAWRAPGGAVAWHKGTNANMLANAATLGVQPGMPVHVAMGLCVAALPQGHAATQALAQATQALAPAGA